MSCYHTLKNLTVIQLNGYSFFNKHTMKNLFLNVMKFNQCCNISRLLSKKNDKL